MGQRLAFALRLVLQAIQRAEKSGADEGIPMLEGKSIGLIIFTLLNGLGLAFLLYALVHFWNEGQRSKGPVRHASEISVYGAEPRVFVVSAPLPAETGRENSHLIQFPIRGKIVHPRGDEAVKHAVR
jgi:hypothetical protein